MTDRPALPDNVMFQFFRTGQALRQLLTRVVDGTGISGEEYGFLSAVLTAGPITPSELAERINMPATTVSLYVARFLERGLIQRRPNDRDRRSYTVEITEAGHALVRVVAPRLAVVARKLAQSSDRPLPEIKDALRTLEQAARAIELDTAVL